MKVSCSTMVLLFLTNHTIATVGYYYCYTSGNFTSNSEYGSSRNDQLFDLASLVKNQDGFYNGNTITIPPTPVPYCFGLCRKDLISSDDCYNCISNSTSEIISHCPVQKQVVAWGSDGGCISQCFPPDHSSPSYEISPAVHICNRTNVSRNYLPQFGKSLANLTRSIAVKAAEQGSSTFFPSEFNERQYFATEESNLVDLHQTIYGVGFCIPSLSTSECTACLQTTANHSGNYCSDKQGATILTPSCVLRYELYPFYEIASTTPSPTPPPSSPSQPSSVRKGSRETKVIVAAIVLPLVAALLVTLLVVHYTCAWNKKKKGLQADKDYNAGAISTDSCFEFNLNTIRDATNDYSDSNKLGQGGFGAVYKGRLPNGQLVAVKRLIRHNAHREEEFKNEVQLVAKLHHRNLARLLGYGLGAKERILVYELAPNGSLDRILFDPIRREHLNWVMRHNIIEGIARGLLYLHEESQLRMIHRDLKAGNVLLDEFMNAKISDFGTARLYADDESNASKVVGTYGYMAPEYAKYGKISVKIDVFSFGVLLLEIVSGTKISKSENPKRMEHLLSKAWKFWTTGKLMQLIDPMLLKPSAQTDEMMRCIHIGLLCVQENPAHRPSMSIVILMLEATSQTLPPPSQPAYFMNFGHEEANVPAVEDCSDYRVHKSKVGSKKTTSLSSSPSHGFSSINEVSFTNTYPEPR